MLRVYLVMIALMVACGDDSHRDIIDAPTHDAPVDAAGSGSNAMTMLEVHPHDGKLDILVAGLSVVVIFGPALGARRRRRRRDAI